MTMDSNEHEDTAVEDGSTSPDVVQEQLKGLVGEIADANAKIKAIEGALSGDEKYLGKDWTMNFLEKRISAAESERQSLREKEQRLLRIWEIATGEQRRSSGTTESIGNKDESELLAPLQGSDPTLSTDVTPCSNVTQHEGVNEKEEASLSDVDSNVGGENDGSTEALAVSDDTNNFLSTLEQDETMLSKMRRLVKALIRPDPVHGPKLTLKATITWPELQWHDQASRVSAHIKGQVPSVRPILDGGDDDGHDSDCKRPSDAWVRPPYVVALRCPPASDMFIKCMDPLTRRTQNIGIACSEGGGLEGHQVSLAYAISVSLLSGFPLDVGQGEPVLFYSPPPFDLSCNGTSPSSYADEADRECVEGIEAVEKYVKVVVGKNKTQTLQHSQRLFETMEPNGTISWKGKKGWVDQPVRLRVKHESMILAFRLAWGTEWFSPIEVLSLKCPIGSGLDIICRFRRAQRVHRIWILCAQTAKLSAFQSTLVYATAVADNLGIPVAIDRVEQLWEFRDGEQSSCEERTQRVNSDASSGSRRSLTSSLSMKS